MAERPLLQTPFRRVFKTLQMDAGQLTAGGGATAKAPNVVIEVASVTCTGDMVVQGKLTYKGGMAGLSFVKKSLRA